MYKDKIVDTRHPFHTNESIEAWIGLSCRDSIIQLALIYSRVCSLAQNIWHARYNEINAHT